MTTWSLFTPGKISWDSCLSRKIWSRRKDRPLGNNWWFSNRAKLRFCSQPDSDKNDKYFPFSIDMEEIKWGGNLLEWKGKKKKSEFSFFVSFLKTKKIKTRVSRPEHSYFLFFFFFWLLLTLHVCNLVCFQFSSVQSLSRVRLFATLWIAACQASLSITNSWL